MIGEQFTQVIDGLMAERLRNPEQRELVVTAMLEGFDRLQKKKVPDAAKRLKNLEDRLRLLSENIRLGFVNGRLVVKVAGSSESLLKELRYGTDWYVPWDKVDEVLLAATLVDPAT